MKVLHPAIERCGREWARLMKVLHPTIERSCGNGED
jgi:hypothetical protein